MISVIAKGLLIPFLGTVLGSACVLFMKKDLSQKLQKSLSGFAAGVMIAAAVWSLLIPSMEQATEQGLGKLGFIPAVVGFCFGMLFLLLLDVITPHMHLNESVEGPKTNLSKSAMMFLAVTLHNIPEGMAVGVLYAGWYTGAVQVSTSAALALAIGIAIQNFPEGAIISMPLHSKGVSKIKACVYGVLSGIVEPVAGLITILLAKLIIPVLPYLLSFAAGAMIYVVVEELVPEMAGNENEPHSNLGTIMFMIGFSLMMMLDVALG
ncbi:MAG: ZIP family metal transporter [Treponema sp.]|nr:ZIP family metal transporter [Treponema sp.]